MLILDGWTHLSEHHLAVFVRYDVNGQVMTPLLCMAPLLIEEADDFSVDDSARLCEAGRTSVSTLWATIAGVNSRLATSVRVRLIGCALHRLNGAMPQELILTV